MPLELVKIPADLGPWFGACPYCLKGGVHRVVRMASIPEVAITRCRECDLEFEVDA